MSRSSPPIPTGPHPPSRAPSPGEEGKAETNRSDRRIVLITLVVLAAIAMAIGLDVASARGYLQWDDSQYLYRGIYHARQVARHSNLLLPRLVYSLSFESPKPPLFTGWIALGARLVGYSAYLPLLFWATAPVFLALLLAIFWLGRRLGGAAAGCLAVACYLSFASSLSVGGSVIVETLLNLTVLAGVIAASCWLRRPSASRAGALGLAIGIALLTKLTAAIFLAPAVSYALVAGGRRFGWKRAGKSAAIAAAAAVVVCWWWYVPNLPAALRFARFSANFPGFSNRVSLPSRLAEILLVGLGWWWAAFALALSVAALLARKVTLKEGQRDCAWMALLAVGVGFVVVLAAPYFEFRFLGPAVPLLSLLGGVLLRDLLWKPSPALRALAVGGLASGFALSVHSYRSRERTPDVRLLTSLLERVQPDPSKGMRIGVLGTLPSFNLYRLEHIERRQVEGQAFSPLFMGDFHNLPRFGWLVFE